MRSASRWQTAVEDGTGTVSGTFNITVTPVNDAPTLDANGVLGVDEGFGGTIDAALLSRKRCG